MGTTPEVEAAALVEPVEPPIDDPPPEVVVVVAPPTLAALVVVAPPSPLPFVAWAPPVAPVPTTSRWVGVQAASDETETTRLASQSDFIPAMIAKDNYNPLFFLASSRFLHRFTPSIASSTGRAP
jgi:hypothetical protein